MLTVDLRYRLTAQEGHGPSNRLENELITQLEMIELEQSISGAAKKLGMSYRYFWGRLEKWESDFGQALVSREQGKAAKLTPLGRKLLWAERTVQAKHAVTIAKLTAELNAAFQAAYDPNAPILSIAGCYDSFLSSLQAKALDAGIITDFCFNTGVEGLEQLNRRECTVAGFNFPEGAPRGSESAKTFAPLINPEEMEGCCVCRRSQGLAVARGNPHGIRSLGDVLLKRLRYAARSPNTGTYTLQETLLSATSFTQEMLAALSVLYPSHTAVATAVAYGQADAGLCIAQAAAAAGADFIPLVWESYYLAWYRSDRALVEPLLRVLCAAGADSENAEEGRDLTDCARLIEHWDAELDWFSE